jgi:hypothetical protein
MKFLFCLGSVQTKMKTSLAEFFNPSFIFLTVASQLFDRLFYDFSDCFLNNHIPYARHHKPLLITSRS